MKKIKGLLIMLGVAAGLGLGTTAFAEDEFWDTDWDAGYDEETFEDDWYYDYYDSDYDYGWDTTDYDWNDGDALGGEDDIGDEGALDI